VLSNNNLNPSITPAFTVTQTLEERLEQVNVLPLSSKNKITAKKLKRNFIFKTSPQKMNPD